jgi:hypothetical protein
VVATDTADDDDCGATVDPLPLDKKNAILLEQFQNAIEKS